MTRTRHSIEFREQALSKARQRGARSVQDVANDLNMSAGTCASGSNKAIQRKVFQHLRLSYRLIDRPSRGAQPSACWHSTRRMACRERGCMPGAAKRACSSTSLRPGEKLSAALGQLPVKPFDDLLQARRWVTELTHWYNHEHRHSAIGFVTPEQRHTQMDISILQARDAVYAAARNANPNRWSGTTRDWSRINEVHLNPQTSDKQNHSHQKTA